MEICLKEGSRVEVRALESGLGEISIKNACLCKNGPEGLGLGKLTRGDGGPMEDCARKDRLRKVHFGEGGPGKIGPG